jgi:Na+-transporting NADH:ubiquinone oxidoreductase subunit C
MAIDKNSTGYTLTFSVVMVVVVGSALAYTALALKERQDANAADKKKMDILAAIGVESTRENAGALFDEYVITRVALDIEGNAIVEESGDLDLKNPADPFNIDIMKDYRAGLKNAAKANLGDIDGLKRELSGSDLRFPLYLCEKEGERLAVVPVVGSGLWGPIWGYVALSSDYQTIYGTKFDHKSETPGLGAEIKETFFTDKFKVGKKMNLSGPTIFEVVKGGASTTEYSVDGITGGTITSKGVGEMLNRTMGIYSTYFQSQLSTQASR